MPTYLGFLRAINLGAKRKFPKDAIRASVERAGFTDVATYINTGNIRFTTAMRSRARIEAVLEEAFLADRGFEVRTIVYSAAEFARIGEDVASLADPAAVRHYVMLLKDEPDAEAVATLEGLAKNGHRVVVRNRAVHLLLGSQWREGMTDPLGLERRLDGVVTSRNVTVVSALAQQWC